MKYIYKFFFILSLTLGSLQAFQISPEQKKIYQVRLSIPFGDPKSDMEAYFFTEWDSPETCAIEDKIESLSLELSKNSKFYFIDVENKNSKELTKANLSFLINANKKIDEYFKFRKDILAGKVVTTTPNLPEEILDAGLKVFSATYNNLKISQLPALVIYNLKTREIKKYEGMESIMKL